MNLKPAESKNQTLVIDSKSKFDYNNVILFTTFTNNNNTTIYI